jgi:glycosyltransferase involved in cell wall biosynthesis
MEEPAWCAEYLGVLVAGREARTLPAALTWRSRRATFRPQDLNWLAAAISDRVAIRKSKPRFWHQTDPGIPFSPLPAGRTIATVYDLIPLRDPAVMDRIRPHRRLLYRLYLRQVQEAGLVIAISETTARQVADELHVPRERIHVVYPALVPLRIRPQLATSQTCGEPEFLFVGVPDPHKRPHLAVDAVAAFRQRYGGGRLTFVGFHPARDRQQLLARAQAANIAGSVSFLDHVTDAELAAHYSSAVLLTLSRIEGFGLPPVEALLSGGRVVAVLEPIYREVLGDAACYAADASPSAVAEAMHRATEQWPDAVVTERLAARYSPRAAADRLRAAYDAAGTG